MPRISKLQKHRPNFPTNDPKKYYRLSLYIPLLEAVKEDLKTRFPEQVLNVYGLNIFLPYYEKKTNVGDATEVNLIVKKYCKILGTNENILQRKLEAEFNLWASKWQREKEIKNSIPSTVLETLLACDADLFPTISKLLQILLTLPVSVASGERSFSTLRRMKTWIRSCCGEDRLSGLALLHIHRNILVDPEKVIDRFSLGNSRRKEKFVI